MAMGDEKEGRKTTPLAAFILGIFIVWVFLFKRWPKMTVMFTVIFIIIAMCTHSQPSPDDGISKIPPPSVTSHS